MKDLKNILLVINPISGNKNKGALVDFIEKELKRKQLNILTYSTEGENDKKAIQQILEYEKIDRILIIGGDGTIKMVAEVVLDLENNISLGIFPGGSANGLALNLGIPESDKDQLQVALGKNIVQMDALKIDDKISLHLSDFGVNAELIRHFEKAELRGKAGYLLRSIPALATSDHPFKFEIDTGDSTFEKEGSVLAIANCQKYGTGAIVNPQGEIDDGKFEVIIFKNLNVINLIKTLTDNSPLDSDFAETFTCTNAKIKCKENVPFQIDGEYIGELDEIQVSVLKNALAIAIPRPS